MRTLNRRDAMIHLGLGTAGLLWAPNGKAAAPQRGRLALNRLTDLAEELRRVPRNVALQVAARAIRAGADYQTLLGAAFMAGVHDVRPRSVGGKLHCVMMVESAFQLAATASDQQACLAALWSIDDFKNSQQRDHDEGEWVLSKRPDVRFDSEPKARRAFLAAMDAWDAEQADRALVGLLPFHDRDSFFELLWPYAARCYVDLGHKIIFCTQVERVIRRLDWRHAEPALRSLINGLLYLSDSITDSELEAFERSRQLASGLPDGWLNGREDPAASAALLAELRASDSASAQKLVVGAFKAGIGPATVWDGLRLYASELFHRRPTAAARRHGPVHGVTEVNAFAYAWRTSRNDATRRLMILQAAAWLPFMRRDLIRFFGDLEGAGLDALGNEKCTAASIGNIFEQPSPASARILIDRQPEAAPAFLEQMRRHLTERAFQSHQYKYAAAIQEEAALVHPSWASRILAPAITYLPTPRDAQSKVLERSLHALQQAGVV